MEKLTTMDMYELCNENQWFTCGTNIQYEKMFKFVEHACINSLSLRCDESIKKLATMIWICSENKCEDDIYNAIRQKFADKNGLYL